MDKVIYSVGSTDHVLHRLNTLSSSTKHPVRRFTRPENIGYLSHNCFLPTVVAMLV